MYEIAAVFLYFSVVLAIGVASYSKNATSTSFIIGNRSLNYWATALSAHASDMSSWLFMAYPAMIFTFGLNKAWIAIGVLLFMFLNWQFVAKRIRIATEETNSLTFFSYLGERFKDSSGHLRITTALISALFYTVYVSVGLIGLGLCLESLFGVPYEWAVFASILIALPYVLIGGYLTLAWIDLFQGLFLMAIIILVPCALYNGVGGWQGISDAASLQQISLQLLPDLSSSSWLQAFSIMLGWGLGYFGQPAIITKFMGIKNVGEMSKSKCIGMSWMLLALAAATFVGLIGIPFFQGSLANPEMVFINLVKASFHPFFIGLILCAVIAASINVMCSQILVLCSTFTEDLYKKIYRPEASSQELLRISRVGALAVALVAFVIAYYKVSTIYLLALYAWSGPGASFGPLLIYSLYAKKPHKATAWAAILSGAITSAIWPAVNSILTLPVEPIIVGFAVSALSIWITTFITKEKQIAVQVNNL